jgi:hypothetical protein
MRTTLGAHMSELRGDEAAHEEQALARDNPRRRREPQNDREDDVRRGNGTSRSPLRHGIQSVRDNRRFTRVSSSR